jgi:GT2 family glycosyltransferase
MDLSVVIPSHLRFKPLLELLESLSQQDLPKEQYEVLVISNLEDPFYKSDEFKKKMEPFQGLYRWVGAINVNRARNLGIQIAKGDVVQLLDDDCLMLESDFLSRVIDLHEAYADATAIGGTYAPMPKADPIDKAYNCVARQWQELDFFGYYHSTRLVGGNVSYKSKKLREACERFDESIQFGATEAEFHLRLQKKGYQTLYLSSLKVAHKTELDPRKLVEKAYRQARGHQRFGVEEGFSAKSYRTFQSTRDLEALRMADSETEYLRIIKYMNLYDWAYNLALENPQWDDRKVYSKSKSWLRKNKDRHIANQL